MDSNAESAHFIIETLKQLEFPNHVVRASNAKEAIAMLQDADRFWRQHPDLILLDLSVADESSLELLMFIKEPPWAAIYRSVPVVVMAGSSQNGEARRAQSLCANVVIPKPQTFPEAIRTLDAVCRVWLKIAVRPGRAEES